MFKPVSEEENEQVELPNVPQEERKSIKSKLWHVSFNLILFTVPVPVKEKSQKTREKVLAN